MRSCARSQLRLSSLPCRDGSGGSTACRRTFLTKPAARTRWRHADRRHRQRATVRRRRDPQASASRRSEPPLRCRCRTATRLCPRKASPCSPGWDLHVHLIYAGHPDARYWFDTYTPQFERVIMPASAEQMLMAGVTTVRDLARRRSQSLPSRSASRAERSPGRRCTSPVRRSRKARTRTPFRRGMSPARPMRRRRPAS